MTAKRDLGDVAVTALTRPGAGSALLAGLGVYLVLVLQSLLGTVAFVVTDVAYGQDATGYLSRIVPATLPVTLGSPLPFAIAVFLAFWQIAPVAPQLRMAHVVTRALLATVVGAVLAGVVAFLVAVVGDLLGFGSVVTPAGGNPITTHLLGAVRSVIPATLDILIQGLVVVPLAALLLWGWLQSHPPKRTPAGALDDV